MLRLTKLDLKMPVALATFSAGSPLSIHRRNFLLPLETCSYQGNPLKASAGCRWAAGDRQGRGSVYCWLQTVTESRDPRRQWERVWGKGTFQDRGSKEPQEWIPASPPPCAYGSFIHSPVFHHLSMCSVFWLFHFPRGSGGYKSGQTPLNNTLGP